MRKIGRALSREAIRHAVASTLAGIGASAIITAGRGAGLLVAGETFTSIFMALLFGLYGPAFLLLTWGTFRRVQGETLRKQLLRSAGGSRLLRFLFLSSPASWAGTVLFVGVASVALLSTDGTSEGPWIIPICVVGVAGSWVLMASVMAVEYMRSWANEDSMIFPGTEERAFTDFIYLSLQLSTTFSSSDVQLTQRGVRGLATLHSVLSFAYSTAVIAVFASLMITLSF